MTNRHKTGGRGIGTPNKLNKELREALKAILDKEFDNLPTNLNKLEVKDRLELLVKLLPYVLPKLQTIEIAQQAEPVTIKVGYGDGKP